MADEVEKKEEVDETSDDTKSTKETDLEDWGKDFDTIMADDTDDEPEGEVDDASDGDDNADGESDDTSAGDISEDELAVLGWSKEELSRIAEVNPKILDDVRELIKRTSEKPSDDKEKAAAESTKVKDGDKEDASVKAVVTKEELEAVKGKMGEEAFGILTKLLDHTNSLQATIGELQAERVAENETAKEQKLVADFRIANKKMDELAKDFPILSNTNKLPKDADGKLDSRNASVRERAAIWNHAEALLQAHVSNSFEEALEESVNWYRGKNGKNLAMREVVRDLNKNKKRFTPRPTHKHTKPKEVDESTAEGKEKVMNDIFNEIGIED
jgi:hypothetical protein